jgi:hypothetical protein
VILIDTENRVKIADVGSKGMTKINDVDILPLTSFEIKNGDIL